MQMSDAGQVVQLFGTERVNEHLAQGWKLLAVARTIPCAPAMCWASRARFAGSSSKP